MTLKEQAIAFRDKFRHFVKEATDADGNPVNIYLVNKSIAKKSALVAVVLLADNAESSEKTNYWCTIKAELEKL
jgi:hypothetical protein